MPDRERWLPIAGWEGLYSVSSHGRVRSEDRPVYMGGKRTGQIRPLTGRILKPGDSNGYQQVGLSINGRQIKRLVHHLVAETFIAPRPAGSECRHKDDDKSNNHWRNLQYGTSSENKLDSVINGKHGNASKVKCKRGHALTGPNIKRRKDKPNVRQCRKCTNDQARAKRQARAA